MALSTHREGRGEPLVLLHGLGSRWQVWAPILPALAQHFDTLGVDLPGFGDSPDTGAATVQAYADEIQRLIPDPFHVAGSSMGGGVALELGRRGHARSVTVFSPIGFWGPLSVRWCQSVLTAARLCARAGDRSLSTVAATRAGRVALFGAFFGHPTRVDPAAAVADARGLAAASGFRAARDAFTAHRFAADPGLLAGIPVTVAWGTRDAILPVFQARRAEQRLPAARHVRLDGCGHLPFADAPEPCARLIESTARRS